MQKSLKAGAQKSKKNRRSSLSIDKNKIKIMPEEAKIEVKQKTLNTVLGKMERGGGFSESHAFREITFGRE